ncbi:hypothetical protein DESUT3_21470 [Desulfuromonas versatilis]|uniref:Sigma-54 factor interaction domain-containing protein n=2 Tax=Desulfuromonas versatilis TaxID=2802975 RepID=A0ABM8HWE1_9BACT|nr:hypothetical protein DESUT3_21470 [Desulfuromonas versatilis]
MVIKELSLSGALVQGLGEAARVLRFSSRLPEQGEVQFCAQVIRQINGAVAVKFYHPDRSTLGNLWEHIRNRLNTGTECPYCGKEKGGVRTRCQACGIALDLEKSDYLDRHLKNTFIQRLQSRLDHLDPINIEKLLNLVDRELLKYHGEPREEEFVGTTAVMLEVFTMIRKVAVTDMNVLILGESGTGKELTARAIHERSDRRDKPFVALNCAAIPEGLIEAELFGYEKGSFTGAYATRKGKFELADGGTIFLDEIGELPPGLQVKLLRFLEDHIVERIGAKGGKKVDVRILAATNCDLKSMAGNGGFRNDLFFRLNAFTITLPPLRERGDDKLVLANYFLKKIALDEGSPVKGFSPEAKTAIMAHPWHGNVREMINKIRRGIVMASQELISPQDMELEPAEVAAEPSGLKKQVFKTQREVVLRTLRENNFVIARAARQLGISRPSLYSLMKKHQIENETARQ